MGSEAPLTPGFGAVLVLTAEDQNLMARARDAFRSDFRYLEQILWQARTRRPNVADEMSA